MTGRGGGAETVHADEIGFARFGAFTEEPLIPALTHGGLDADAHGGASRENLAAIGFVLFGEKLHAGHGDHAGADTLGFEEFLGLEGGGDFGACRDQDGLTLAVCFGEHIGAFLGQVGVLGLKAHGRQVLAGERENRGRVLGGQGDFPGLGGLGGVGGAEHIGVRRGAADGEVFDRLVGRAVFADADRVVGHDKDRRDLHQGREAHGRAGIVGEAEEGAAIGADATVQRHAVHRRRHAVFADAPIDVASGAVVHVEDAEIVGFGVVGAGQVG